MGAVGTRRVARPCESALLKRLCPPCLPCRAVFGKFWEIYFHNFLRTGGKGGQGGQSPFSEVVNLPPSGPRVAILLPLPAMDRPRKSDSNRPHWHVMALTPSGTAAFMVGVRMSGADKDAEAAGGRHRRKRRWFMSSSAAAKAKRKLREQGREALVFQCPPPEDECPNGPP